MKIFKSILAFALLTAISIIAIAAAEPQSANTPAVIPAFMSFRGTVKNVTKYEDRTMYSIEKDNQIIANIVADGVTYIEGAQEINEGDVIEAFYDTSRPMILIYPPQITAAIITVNFPDSKSIKVDQFKYDTFYGGYLSSDGMLLAYLANKTTLLWQDGTEYNGDVNNIKMAVVYGLSTRSVPSKTTPEKIIFFFPETDAPLNGNIVVESKKIEAPLPYVNASGTVMVPVRAVAEALGYTVNWDGENQSVMLNNIIALTIGKDYYTYAKTAPIELGAAPVLIQGRTYVPIEFFNAVMRIKNVRVTDGQVLIDNTEPIIIIE